VQQEQEDGGTQASVTREASARTALEADMVEQLQAKNSFLANLAVFRTSDKMLGTLLDDKA
jgi:flagellar hook protein FlgE